MQKNPPLGWRRGQIEVGVTIYLSGGCLPKSSSARIEERHSGETEKRLGNLEFLETLVNRNSYDNQRTASHGDGHQ